MHNKCVHWKKQPPTVEVIIKVNGDLVLTFRVVFFFLAFPTCLAAEFPIVCEKCIGESLHVRMAKAKFGLFSFKLRRNVLSLLTRQKKNIHKTKNANYVNDHSQFFDGGKLKKKKKKKSKNLFL
jgi:hypothetical protein